MIKKIILKLGKMRKLITSVPILLPILLVLLLPETLWATTYNITFAAQDNEGGWGDVPQGATNQPVLKIKTTLVAKEATISSIRVHSLNTADADVTNVHIYTDNADAVFDGDETLQGSTDTWSVGYATITTNFTIAAADVNFYIYVTYDVSGSAGIGNTLDCDIEAVGDINVTGDVDNSAYSLSGTGSRIVAAADNSPPCAISDLTALAEGSTLGSRIKIKWTAPGDDGTGGGNASYFLVKYSSNYIGADDFYAAWVSTWGLFSTGTAAGSEELHVLTGFDEGTTYYFAIRTRDEKPNWSIWPGTSTNINSLSFTVPTDSAPIRITSLSALTGSTGGEIDLDWLAPGDDGTIGDITNGMWRIKYSSDSTHIWDTMSYTLDISTSATYGLKYSTTLAGLNEGATYYFYIKAGDEKPNWSGLSNKATAWAKVTPPPTPTTVVISQIGENYDGTAAPDYVELYNTTNEPIDLSAASVQRGTGDLGTITKQNLSGTIPAYGFYLVGDEDAVTPALLYPLTPDTTNTTWTINEGDWVAYVSNQTNVDAVEKINDPDVVDWVGLYDGVTPNPNHEGADAAPDPGAGYCERLSQLGDLVADLQNGGSRALFGNSYDTNENANDFVRTTTGEHPNSKPQNSESPHEIPSTPTISGFTPDTGPVGTTVTINGTYFGAVRISSDAYSHIYFYNGVEADYTIGDFVWCDTKVVVGVPAGAETGKIWFCTQDDFAGHTGTSTVNFTLGAAEDTTPPAAISDLTALAEGSTLGGRITVKWTAPGDDGTGGGNASQFLVKYSTNYIGADDFYAAWVSTWGLFSTGTAAGSEELHVLTGFDEGTTYYFAIRTRDEIPNWSIWPGTSTNVNSLSFTIPTDSAPATITSLSALTGSSGGEIDLTWLAPGDDGTIGDISTGTWRIKYSSDSTHTWDTMSYTLDISTSASYGLKYSTTIAGLLNETTYYFYIEAGDEKPNWSGLSNKTTAQTLDAVAPAAISDLTALEGSNGGEVKLKWTAPGDNGMTGNIAGGAYKIKYSSVAIITGSQFDSPPASYTVTTIDISTDTTPGEEHSRDITGLLEGTSYWFAMKTEDEANNWAVWNSSNDVSTVNLLAYSCPKDSAPASITNLSALTGSSGGEIDLTWSVPGDDGWTGAITDGKYRIRYATIAAVDWTTDSSEWIDFDDKYELEIDTDTSASGEMHGRTMTSLHEGVTYYFRINTGDEKPNWSGLSNNATAWAKITLDNVPPCAISNLTALAEGSPLGGRITLKWSAPGDDGTMTDNSGGSYEVKYATKYIGTDDYSASWVNTYTQSWTPTATWGDEELKIIDGSNFKEGTTYWFAIKASDSSANQASWTSSGTVSSVNTNNWTVPIDSAPATITSLSALTGSSAGEIDLTWLAPGDDGTIGDISTGTWRIKYSSDSTHTWDTMSYTLDISTSASYGLKYSTTIAGLLNETTYYFYIEAGDEKPNWSGLSNKTTAQTLDAVAPAAISDLTALEGTAGGEVKLKWTAPGDNGMTGNIAGGAYKIKYSSVAIITGSQFDSPPASYTVTTIDISTDTTPGEEHSRDITGLLEGTSYWFAMKTEDEANNWAVWNSSQDVSSVNNVAYSCPKDSAPASITNLSALTGSTGGEIDLTWSVPGDDGWTGAITGGKYRIRYATYSTVDWTSASGEWIDFDDKYELELDTDTNAAGEMHGRTMTSLHEGVTYYFRINTGDEKPNWSGLSNNATAWAKVSEVLVLPSPVSNLTALAGSWSGDVVLKWTAPGNDGTVGTAAGYLLRYSSNYISAADFYALWVSTWVPSYGWGPKASKSEESYTITGLITGTTYWFVLKAYSDAGNYAIWNSSGDNSAVNNNNWSLPGISPGTTSFLHITEVMANAPTELTDEYVEVYNAGTTAIDLNGYSIRDILEADDIYDDWATNYDLVGGAVIEDAYRNGASTSSTILQPGYYALFMDSDYGQGTPSQVYYFKPNCIILAVDDTNIGNALSNTTDGVGLWTSPAGVHIDSFTWSSTPVDMPWTKITSTGAGKIDTSGDWDDSVSSSPARQHPTYVSYNMLASEISTQTAASASVSQGDTNKTVLACKVPGHDNSISQNLIGVRLSTAGTTTTMLKDDDISAIKVWQDVDGDNAYSAGDSYLGTLTYNVSYAVWECQQTVTMATGSSGRKIVFTIDIAAGGTNGRKFQAKLPQYNGLMVDSGYHGPYDTSCANSGIITIGAAGDTTAPAAVTAISASTYTVTGYVQLEWQSPGDDDWSDDLPSGSSFTIQYATFTTVDWSTSSAQIIIDASGTSTGTVVSTTTLLSAETTYYFRLWTNDEIPNYSGISYGATVWCRIRPEAVTTLSSLALDDGSGDVQLTWIAPGDDGTTGDITDGQWKIRYSTFSSVDWTTDSDEWTDFDDKYELLFDTTSVSPLSGQTQNITGLHGNVTYYFRLWTRDENTGANSPGNWSLVSNASTVTVTAVLGISISPSTYDYGNLNASSAVVNGTTITVTNTGNITETYSLFSSSAIGSGKGWLIKDSPGNDEFSLSAGFNTVEPSSTTFVADNILSTTTVKCTAAKFALNETGIDVIKDALRNIWFLIKTPDSTSTIDEKEITATITAGTP